jgi:hypothetical protein
MSQEEEEEFESIEYEGKTYFIDNSEDPDIVMDMNNFGQFIPVGKIISKKPLKIDFSVKFSDAYETGNSLSLSELGDTDTEEEPQPVVKKVVRKSPQKQEEKPKTPSKRQIKKKAAPVEVEDIQETQPMKQPEEETVDMTEVEYLGKQYIVDMSTKEVYEKAGEGYELVGAIVKENPIKIKFGKVPDWKEEYADIEPHRYKGEEYMVNPITNNVFKMNSTSGEYEYVGELVTLDPLEIKLDALDEQIAQRDEESEESDEVELEIIASHGIKYVRDNENNIYEGKNFELVGIWDKQDNDINFIPTRGFLNVNNSCYINSVLFALLYRSSKFIDDQILRKDVEKMMRSLRINKQEIIDSVKANQTELLKVYKWLHNIEQAENTTRVCQPFRQIFKQVNLEKNPLAFHDENFETKLGDSGEFLFTLFNGFNVKTLVKEVKSFGRNASGEMREIFNKRDEIAPIILVPTNSSSREYYNLENVSRGEFNVVVDMPESDGERYNLLETKIKIEKIKILLVYFQKKTRIPKIEKTGMQQTIEQIGDKITERNISDVESIYAAINSKVLPKEKREIEDLYEKSEHINTLSIELGELKEKYKFNFTEKIDRTIYKPLEGTDSNYIVLGIDRSKHVGKTLVKDTRPFDIKERIQSPTGKEIELTFVVKYIESPKHYVCYFKNVQDDMWYLYNDLNQKLRIVSLGSEDDEPGTFEKMKGETQKDCTLLFYE